MKRFLILIISLFVCLLLSTASINAQDYDVGVEWINEYGPTCEAQGLSDLGGRDDTAVGFYNVLTAHGYTGRFSYGNDSAWANDFMDRDVVASGTDHVFVDTVDIAYHADHGNVGLFCFGNPKDRCVVNAADVRWGDNDDLEWMVLDDCSTLRQGQYGVWWPAFQNLHMIISFDTNAHDDGDRGRIFAEKLVEGWSVQQAWWYASEQTEGSSTYAAIAGASNGDTTIYDEGIWTFRHVAPDPMPIQWWWWVNHKC